MTASFDRGETGGLEFIQEGEALTTVETEAFLKRLNNELVLSQLAIRRARTHAANCKKAYEMRRIPLLLSAECPPVGRGVGEVTVAERDAWINNRIMAEYQALNDAKIALENAIDYGWQVKDQVRIMQSLNNNAKEIYRSAR
ncbi:hypothetical protein [Microbispora sp. ATCC PTA-5024]|uniref:hypothetical protein n=1 Tax=Microbispora sp. ATCC PTA-5024 TaxID=316330 RepID=UPI0003DDDBE6|nr:hypothetical protein [Microbispora sp. ATCC PTA-5024]ETK36175.1 hypothetical protein MPTA5024_11150 [Microbispora sp. ATCC PTA-5024]